MLAILLALALTPGERPVVVVTAAPPLDAERLAETLRAYLDEPTVEVQVVPPTVAGELRDELAALRGSGANLRAIAAIRVVSASESARGGHADRPRAIEIALVDLVTDKTLLASVPAVTREADLYRFLALKIQSLLRSALYEAVTTAQASPEVERLVAAPAAPPSESGRLSWETGYAVVSFPLDGILLQGLAVRGSWSPRPWLSFAATTRLLTPLERRRDDVALSMTRIPVALSAGLDHRGARFTTRVGLCAELAVERMRVRQADATTTHTQLVPSVGLEAGASVHLVGSAALFLRATSLAILDSRRYTVRAAPAIDPSRWQVGADAGLSLSIW